MKASSDELLRADAPATCREITSSALWWARPLLYKGGLVMAGDLILILSIFLVNYYFRFLNGFTSQIWPLVETPNFSYYLGSGLLLAGTWIFLIWKEGGYGIGLFNLTAPFFRFRVLISTAFQSLLILVAFSYFFRDLLISRQVILLTVFFSLLGMGLNRRLVRNLQGWLVEKELVAWDMVVVGHNGDADDFIRRFKEEKGLVRMIGYISWERRDGHEAPREMEGLPVLGSLDEAARIYDCRPFHKMVVVMGEGRPGENGRSREKMMEVVNFCEQKGVSLYILPGHLDVAVTRRELGTYSGMPLIRLQDSSVHPFSDLVKRMLDVTGAGLTLILGLPLWLIIAALIKLNSPGPVFFVQERAGRFGRPFKMYKFRSMVQDAEDKLRDLVDLESLDEPVFKIRNDPRVTRVGRFLRRTSLDEIPQIINVLKGEMSLVGPRPEEMALVDKYNVWQRRRLKEKPGLTGYQQIKNRGEPSLRRRIQYDLFYIKHRCLFLDLYIMAMTLVVVLRGSGTTH